MLKVYRKTELGGNYDKDRPFGENVQIFYIADLTSDYDLKPIMEKTSPSFRLRYLVIVPKKYTGGKCCHEINLVVILFSLFQKP